MFERFLRSKLQQLKSLGHKVANEKAWRLDDLKTEFAAIGVRLTEPAVDWQEIKKLQAIRNCIAHNDGWIDEESFEKLAPYGFEHRQTFLALPENYFADTLSLIGRMCRKVTADCSRVQ